MKTDEVREAIKPAETSWLKYERHRVSHIDQQGLKDRHTKEAAAVSGDRGEKQYE